MRIYLAGKIAKNDWRHEVVTNLGRALVIGDQWSRWPVLEKAVFGAHDYVGPFFISDDHGCAHGAGAHGVGIGLDSPCVEAGEDHGISGGADLDNRLGLIAALGELRALGAGVLVVAKRDRLARDVYVAATIERALAQTRARVVTADGTANGDTPADAFMRTILDGAAAYERALIRARTRGALAAKRARGERTGALPYGFVLASDGTRLVEEPAEQAVLAVVRDLRRAGLSIRAIVAELAARQLVSRAGRSFAPTQIHRMVAA